MIRWVAGRLFAWAEAVLATEPASPDGPPAHWLAKVRKGAPELLHGAPQPAAARRDAQEPEPRQVQGCVSDDAPSGELALSKAGRTPCDAEVVFSQPRDGQPSTAEAPRVARPPPAVADAIVNAKWPSLRRASASTAFVERPPAPGPATAALHDRAAPPREPANHDLHIRRPDLQGAETGLRLPKPAAAALDAPQLGAAEAKAAEAPRTAFPRLPSAPPPLPAWPAIAKASRAPALHLSRARSQDAGDVLSAAPHGPRWPELRQAAPENRDVDDLLRELDRRTRLAAEQRGG